MGPRRKVGFFIKTNSAFSPPKHSLVIKRRPKWEEINVRIFEEKSADNAEELWDRYHFLASLWASVSKEFQDSSFFFIHQNCDGVLR